MKAAIFKLFLVVIYVSIIVTLQIHYDKLRELYVSFPPYSGQMNV